MTGLKAKFLAQQTYEGLSWHAPQPGLRKQERETTRGAAQEQFNERIGNLVLN